MDFELKDLLEAIGPNATLIFAAWIFLSFLQQRYTAAYDRYRALVPRQRGQYDAASQLLRGLTETRFKLLALVPSLAGAVIAFATARRTGLELLAIGLLGLAATLGVLLYELRNGEIKGEIARRVQRLEHALLPSGPLVVNDQDVMLFCQ